MLKRNLWHPAEFQYPASWLVDQRLFRRAAEQAERQRPLDPPPLGCAPQTRSCILSMALCNSSSAALIDIPTHACTRRQASVVSVRGPCQCHLPHRQQQQPKAERRVAEPTVAYGPAGSTGEENVSIIAAPIHPGFRRCC